MISAADVRALVLTPDEGLASTFLDISRELGVMADISDLQNGAPPQLGREKYEALLIDFDAVENAAPALAALRANPSNRGSVIFAVATANERQQLALTNGANFVLSRPVDTKELRRTLYAAYEVMTQERRRYFRCTADLPVFVTTSDGADLVARTTNVSGSGMSIASSKNFKLGERVGISLELRSGGSHVLARGAVVWDDRHGKTGISFQCVRPELHQLLDSWLDEQFHRLREESVRELQKSHAAGQARS
jgi:CheY-like chemotaxis protein